MKHGCNRKGKTHTLYTRWASMKQRCYNPNHTAFKNYGGRGITICDRWKEFKPFFEDILSEIGDCPGKGYTLDRIDNNGNYEPKNIKWSTYKEQNNNKRSKHTSKIEIKRCGYCGRFLGMNSFKWSDRKKGYRSSHCKKCLSVQNYLWRLDHSKSYTSEIKKALNRYSVVSKEMGLSKAETLNLVLDHFMYYVKQETEQKQWKT